VTQLDTSAVARAQFSPFALLAHPLQDGDSISYCCA
jgi:hypothetical protein